MGYPGEFNIWEVLFITVLFLAPLNNMQTMAATNLHGLIIYAWSWEHPVLEATCQTLYPAQHSYHFTAAVSNVAPVQGHNNCRVSSQLPQYRWQLIADMFLHNGSCLQMSSCTRYPNSRHPASIASFGQLNFLIDAWDQGWYIEWWVTSFSPEASPFKHLSLAHIHGILVTGDWNQIWGWKQSQWKWDMSVCNSRSVDN